MLRINDSDFIYAVSRIRTIENRLLGQSGIERMLEAQTVEQAMKILQEAGYGSIPHESVDMDGFNRVVTEEQRKLYTLLREVSPRPGIFDVFLLPYDFQNVKVILKAEFAGRAEYDNMLMYIGSMDPEQLKEILRDRTLDDLPEIMREAVEEAIEDLGHTGDPETVDFILDGACSRMMKTKAVETGSRVLAKLVADGIDALNIQMFIRCKKLGEDDELLRAILPGGGISREVFERAAEKSLEQLIEVIASEGCSETISRIIADNGIGRYEDRPERLTSDLVHEYIKIGKQKFDGLEPLIGYMMSKEEEIRKVRELMTYKINGLSPERFEKGWG